MLRDAAIQLCLTRLGNRGGEAALVTSAETEIQLAQKSLENKPFLPWFLETDGSGLELAVSAQTVALPGAFLRMLDEDDSELWLTDAEGTKQQLPRKDKAILVNSYQEDDPAMPVAYAVTGRTLWFSHVADIAYPVTVRYFARDTALTTNITNNWLTEAPSLLIAALGMTMAKYTRDAAAFEIFQSDATAEFNSLVTTDAAMREAGRSRKAGSVI
jgi:hypothetical protein